MARRTVAAVTDSDAVTTFRVRAVDAQGRSLLLPLEPVAEDVTVASAREAAAVTSLRAGFRVDPDGAYRRTRIAEFHIDVLADGEATGVTQVVPAHR